MILDFVSQNNPEKTISNYIKRLILQLTNYFNVREYFD